MKRIDEDIKNKQFHNAYLLFGDEAYLILQNVKKLKDAIIPNGDTMNYNEFSGSNIDINEIIELAETMPFFNDYRLIVLSHSNLFKNANDTFCDYLEHINPSTIFVFVEPNELLKSGEKKVSVDKRTKAFKQVSKTNVAIDYSMPTDRELQIWILGKIKRENKQMDAAAYTEFYNRTNQSMSNMSMELEKLLSYTYDKDVITKDDVMAICTPQLEARIFDMIDAMSSKNQSLAMSYYHDMLGSKEPAIKILVLMERQFRNLYAVKDLYSKRMNSKDISQKLSVQEFIVKKNINCIRNYTNDQLKEALNDFAETESAIKTGRMDENVGVELLILKYSN